MEEVKTAETIYSEYISEETDELNVGYERRREESMVAPKF